MLRRTKIVATLGPATDDPKILGKLIDAGLDMARLNFSHGSHAVHIKRAENVRAAAEARGKTVGLLMDLQGPKIRIGKFKNGDVILEEGDQFIIDADYPLDEGTAERVGTTYKTLPQDVGRGCILLLDDGRISMEVEQVEGTKVVSRVVIGGHLTDNKGINRQGGGLTAAAITNVDREAIKVAAAIKADYLAVSFTSRAADVQEARRLFHDAGGHGGIVSKIERAEAIENIEEIVRASDVIMIARGDLAVEIGDAAVPPIQKRIIRMARRLNKITITATQMMESMIENSMPTRAEVSDVANAVLDGTDAVMLSAETAVGKFPVAAVAAMDRVCRVAEMEEEATHSEHRMSARFLRVDEAIAMATMYTANHLDVKAIIALTESGGTPLWMSRISSGVPIYALTRHVEIGRKMSLFRGVCPVVFDQATSDHAIINREAIEELIRRNAVRDGDLVIITKGDLTGIMGGTNAMKIAVVGKLPAS